MVNCNTSLDLTITKEEYSYILDMAKRGADVDDTALSKDVILRAMIRLLQRLPVDVSCVKTEDQLLERLQNAVRVN